MGIISQTELPKTSLLSAYATSEGCYTDCFQASVDLSAEPNEAFERYVFLFFDSPVFRLERLVLRLFGKAPPDRTDPIALARGNTDVFAAWRVEARHATELLLLVPETPICTWLALEAHGDTAILRFGSAILSQEGKSGPHWAYRVTAGAHRAYSRMLLRAATADWNRGKGDTS